MTATVKKNAYRPHFAEKRFNGRKGKVVATNNSETYNKYEQSICIEFKDGESAWFSRKDLK